MNQPDQEVSKAIFNLKGTRNWEIIVAWIRDSEHSAAMALYENTVFNAGRVAELHNLLSTIDQTK